MIIRRQTETRFVVAAAAPVVAEAIQSARRPQRPAGEVGEAVDVVVYREQERAKKLLQYVCGVCVCTTTTAVTSTTTSGSLTPAADSHGNRPCLLPALAGAEKRPQIACRRRPANGGHLCVNIDHSRGTSSSKGCPWSQHSTEPAEGLKIWGRG